MSDYMSCIIEFDKNDCKPLIEKIKACEDHFSEAYITPFETYVVHFTGNHLDGSPKWMAILDTARKIENTREDFYHTMVYSEEYDIDEEGMLMGCAYVGLVCEGEHITKFEEFIKRAE